MTRLETFIQVLKICFAIYFTWWSIKVLELLAIIAK